MMAAVRTFLARALRQACGLVLAAVVTLAFLQVVLRYAFASSIVWVEEISVLLLLLLCWLGAAQLWLTRGHILVDLLFRAGRARRWADRLIDLLALVTGVFLARYTIETLQSFQGIEMGSLELDASLRYYPILAGAAGIALAALLNLIAPPAPDGDPDIDPDGGSAP